MKIDSPSKKTLKNSIPVGLVIAGAPEEVTRVNENDLGI
jgi:hypothetical protein